MGSGGGMNGQLLVGNMFGGEMSRVGGNYGYQQHGEMFGGAVVGGGGLCMASSLSEIMEQACLEVEVEECLLWHSSISGINSRCHRCILLLLHLCSSRSSSSAPIM